MIADSNYTTKAKKQDKKWELELEELDRLKQRKEHEHHLKVLARQREVAMSLSARERAFAVEEEVQVRLG